MILSTAILIGITVWVVVLCYTDVVRRELPDGLTLGGASIFLLLHFLTGGMEGFLSSLGGGFACAALLLLPFVMKAAGAGDIKMLFAAGTLVSWHNVVAFLTWTAYLGIPLCLLTLLWSKTSGQRLKHYLRCLVDLRYDRKAGRAGLPGKDSERERVPFGIAIGMAVLVVLVPQLSA